MSLKNILLAILVVFFANNIIIAQNDSTDNMSYYFDDGGISESRNILKLNVLSTINGDVSMSYERIFNPSFGLEVGLGVIVPFYITEFPYFLLGDEPITDPTFGYSVCFQPRYYLFGEAPELIYIGLLVRERKYVYNDENIVLTDLVLNYGGQYSIGRRMTFDYSFGIGIRANENKFSFKFDDLDFVMPCAIKFGYLL